MVDLSYLLMNFNEISKMSNPLWILGGKSPNPGGRPKSVNSVRTVAGMCERFIKRNFTPNKLQKLFDTLTETQKLELYTTLLPYCVAKKQADTISTEEIDRLYDLLKQAANNEVKAKAS